MCKPCTEVKRQSWVTKQLVAGALLLRTACGLRGSVRLSLQVVEELLKPGPALNAIDADGCSALHLAAQDGHLEVCILLITR